MAAAESRGEEEAERLKRKAEELREQIREMESRLGDDRPRNYDKQSPVELPSVTTVDEGMTLKNKRVLVTGANGRLGSMVCRYLLRNHPQTEVVAAVHYVGEDSPTARGYARLSYEVGAEDGIGSIGAAWSPEDRTATFAFDPTTMADYNLQNLRLVECELLDPNQCMSIAEGCDSVIWCATDFNGNQPRAVSGLNVALLFRAVTQPDKGRVEVEGLENMLGALKSAKLDKQRRQSGMNAFSTTKTSTSSSSTDPINFVLVSVSPEAYQDFETPFGSFYGIKRQGEGLLNDFPSLSSTVLQLSRFEDNFCAEGLDVNLVDVSSETGIDAGVKARRKINRRDAAKAAVDALLNDEIKGQTVSVWTAS